MWSVGTALWSNKHRDVQVEIGEVHQEQPDDDGVTKCLSFI